jgi:hypothetical protein
MKKPVSILLLCVLSSLGCAQRSTGYANLTRTKLAKPREIQGHLCAKGYTWFYKDGQLRSCALTTETDFGVAHVPAGSWINLRSDGKPDSVFLERDTSIAGYQCRGGNRLLGPTEGAKTGLYPNGNLEICWLTEDLQVQGVPCSGSSMFSGDSGVELYESGKLKACKLSRDFGSLKRGQRFRQSQKPDHS